LCQKCHSELIKEAQGGSNHVPFAGGMCLTCHSPHASDVSGVLLDKQKNICFSCHTDLGKGIDGGKSKHQPVSAGECTKCHSPHKSKLSKLLLAEGPDLCLSCHKTMKARMEKERNHPPAASDCLQCHKPHFSSEGTLLSQPIKLLCGDCHDVKDSAFSTAHIGIDADVIDCRTCHNPHSSSDPKFFKDTIHPPFAARTCEECHIVGGKK